MIICVSGYTGSGKSSVGEELAKVLNIKHVTRSYKEFVEEHRHVVKFQSTIKPSFVKKFDREVVLEAKRAKNCVVTSWLSPWMVKGEHVNVWLYASLDTRANRVMKHVKLTYKKTEEYIKKKDSQNKKSWKKLYNIDLDDHSIFDIEINTENLTTKQVAAIIAAVSIEKEKKKFE